MISDRFPLSIIAAARASRAKWDIPASVCLAQWALESAWGTSMPRGSNNPFGIKAVGTQPSVAALTHEIVDGRSVAITARFRAFATVAEAFEAHAELLATNSHYAPARLARHDADAFARALTGVYATDPDYGSKLIGLMAAHRLYAYDAPASPAATSRDVAPAPAAKPASPIPASPAPASPKLSWAERLWVALTFRKAA